MADVYRLKKDGEGEDKPVTPRGARYFHDRPSFRSLSAAALAGYLSSAERGQDLDRWVYLCEEMLRDPHVRSVDMTRATSIVGAEILVEPGVILREEDEEIAEQAAADFRRELDATTDLESTLTALLHAENVGWAGAEHSWRRINGWWHSDPRPIDPADISFANDWTPIVRTFADEKLVKAEYITSTDHPRSRWIWHLPRKVGTLTTAGDFRAIVWHWWAKRWAFLFRQEGLELFAAPLRIGKVAKGAPLAARRELEAALVNQSNSQAMVIEEGAEITLLQPSGQAGDAWNAAIDHIHAEITKAHLGSTLNTEVGSTGGNRSLGESQAKQTILPRLAAMSRRLESTVESDWARPFVRFNSADRYGGRIPPTPQVRIKLVQDERVPFTDGALAAGVVTVDELRESEGLEPWGPDRGGDRVVTVGGAPPPGPMASSPAGGPDEPDPFALAVRRLTHRPTASRTSATSSDSRPQIATVPYSSSDDREL